ncbi:hypothetical protein D3C80_2116010 [compost metagenome]
MQAFRTVSFSATLPATTVTPRTSSSGEASASHRAMASSTPGSVSIMMRWFIRSFPGIT